MTVTVGVSPKPRVKCTNPPQFMCGWCRKWDVLENLRCSPSGLFEMHYLLGNNWPIHTACYIEWYDKGPDALGGKL